MPATAAPGAQPPAPQNTSLGSANAAASKYRDVVMAELNLRKRYPEAARPARLTGVVMAAFTIGANGQVSAISIMQSSGHAALDGAVRQLITALTLPPPPGGPIRVDVPVEFKVGF